MLKILRIEVLKFHVKKPEKLKRQCLLSNLRYEVSIWVLPKQMRMHLMWRILFFSFSSVSPLGIPFIHLLQTTFSSSNSVNSVKISTDLAVFYLHFSSSIINFYFLHFHLCWRILFHLSIFVKYHLDWSLSDKETTQSCILLTRRCSASAITHLKRCD